MSEERRIDVNWVQAVGGALAAMSSAVLLSTVGVAGTIIGAAVGSVIATVGSAVYSHYLETSKKRVAVASITARERAARARGRMKGAAASQSPQESRTEQMDLAREDLSHAEEDLETVETSGPRQVGWREVFQGLRWKHIVLVAAGVFVVAMGVIFTFEAITGRAVSTFTGGSEQGTRSSIPGTGSGDGKAEQTPTPTPSQTPTEELTDEATPAETPTEETTEPSPDEPTSEPTEEEPSTSPTVPAPLAPTASESP